MIKLTGDLERGQHIFQQSGNLVATVWRDKKLVYVLSTQSNPQSTDFCTRKQRDGTTLNVPVHESIMLYNKYMGGVDRAEFILYVEYEIKKILHVKLYHKILTFFTYRYIFYFLVEVYISNSFILHKNYYRTHRYQQITSITVFNFLKL